MIGRPRPRVGGLVEEERGRAFANLIGGQVSSCLMSAMTKRLTSFIVARSRVRRTHQLSTAAKRRSTAPAEGHGCSLISHNSSGIVAPSSKALDDAGVEAAGGA